MKPIPLPTKPRPTRAELRRRGQRITNAVIVALVAVCAVSGAFLIGG